MATSSEPTEAQKTRIREKLADGTLLRPGRDDSAHRRTALARGLFPLLADRNRTLTTAPHRLRFWLRRIDRWIAYANSVVEE